MAIVLESFLYEESEEVSKTNETDWKTKLEIDVTPRYTGNILVEWSLEAQPGEENALEKPHIKVRVVANGTEVLNEADWCPDEPGHWLPVSGFKRQSIVKDQDLNLKIQFCACSEEPGFVSVRRARLLLSNM